MIFAFIFILIAWTWLMIETDMLRIHLLSGAESSSDRTSGFEPDDVGLNPTSATPYHPTVFTELDMPELNGNLNIVCKRSN